MTTFKTAYDKRVEFKRIGSSMHLDIETKDGMNIFNVILDPADAPAIALAALKAAGMGVNRHEAFLSDQLTAEQAAEKAAWFLSLTEAKASAAAEEAARDKRRDELALKFTGQSIANFDEGWVVDLIDRIIDTENELAKERAK